MIHADVKIMSMQKELNKLNKQVKAQRAYLKLLADSSDKVFKFPKFDDSSDDEANGNQPSSSSI